MCGLSGRQFSYNAVFRVQQRIAAKCHRASTFREGKRWDEARVSQARRVYDNRVAAVLKSKGLSHAQQVESVDRRWRLRKRPEFFNNLWPLDFIMFPARVIGLPLTMAARRHSRERDAHFDPSKIATGMNVRQVDEIYGEPTRIHDVDGRILRVYGKITYPSTWVAVQFEGRRAVGIFKNHFFQRTWIVTTK